MSRPSHIGMLLLAISIGATQSSYASGLKLGREVLGSTGGVTSGGTLRHGFTLGQVASGRAASTGLIEVSGFWHASPAPTLDAPDPPAELPRAFALGRAAPNPFAGRASLRFAIPGALGPTHVEIRVFDVAGRMVRVLERGTRPPGEHIVAWNGTDDSGSPLRNGVYFCAMEAASFRAVRRMVLIR